MGLNKVVAERYNRVLKVAGVVPDVTAASKVQGQYNHRSLDSNQSGRTIMGTIMMGP
jgi:hypothetical protein